MDFAQHLADAGRVSPPNGNSSYNIVNAEAPRDRLPGRLAGDARRDREAQRHERRVVAYQAFLAFAAAMGAVSIFSLLGRVTRNALLRCVGAAVAIQPNVLYGYALEAGIKELTTAALLMVVAAVLAESMPGEGRATSARAARRRHVGRVRRVQPRHRSVARDSCSRRADASRCVRLTAARLHAAELARLRRRRDRHLAAGADHRGKTRERRRQRDRRRRRPRPRQPHSARLALVGRRRVADRRLPLPARPRDLEPRVRRDHPRARRRRRAVGARAPALDDRRSSAR